MTLAEHFARLEELDRGAEHLDPALRRMMMDHVLNSAMLFGPMIGWDAAELAERVKAWRARLSTSNKVVAFDRARRRAGKTEAAR
jgi:hypothetical protein